MKKAFGRWKNCRRWMVDSRLLLGFLFFLPLLQGCSLLFVAKGGTHYVQGGKEKAPQAASEEREMEAPPFVEYKVLEGDSFKTISQRFFGNTSKASKIARANHLNRWRDPKKYTILKIIDPVFFPSPEELAQKVVLPQPKSKRPRASRPPQAPSTPSPSPTPEPTPQKFDKVPRPKVNNAFVPGEKLKFEIRALSIL